MTAKTSVSTQKHSRVKIVKYQSQTIFPNRGVA